MTIPPSSNLFTLAIEWNTLDQLKRRAEAVGCRPGAIQYAMQVFGDNVNAVADYLQWHVLSTEIAEMRLTKDVKAHRLLPVAVPRTHRLLPAQAAMICSPHLGG